MITSFRRIVLTFAGLLLSAAFSFGAGNTSIVHLSEVHSVKIEPRKITVIGTGYVKLWIARDLEKGATSGEPDPLIRAKTSRGIFEIIPYFSDPEIKGVPTGGHSEQNLKELSEKWWAETQKYYASITVGNSATIWYQEDKIVLSEYQVQKITGAGSVSVPMSE